MQRLKLLYITITFDKMYDFVLLVRLTQINDKKVSIL